MNNTSYTGLVLLSNSSGQLAILDMGNGIATHDEIALWYDWNYDINTEDLKVTQLTNGRIHMNYEQLSSIVKAKHDGRVRRDKGYMEILPEVNGEHSS